jgi:hypothetical protein
MLIKKNEGKIKRKKKKKKKKKYKNFNKKNIIFKII